MKPDRHPRHLRRRPACEPLEPRLALSGSPTALENAQALTLSFVPDGTSVEGHLSSLTSVLAGQSKLATWQNTVARAFQTWAQYADVNVGIVPDGGQPLGIRGQTHNDPRFGDIRVAGIPLDAGTLGEATGDERLLAGTWAGDVVLNAASPFASDAKLYQVALHEAGHALGLSHSSDPNSPMFAHDGSPTSGPTANDIANLQALYGPRRPDIYEGSGGNDTISSAARIPHSEPVDGFDGTTPLIVYGDVHDAADKDMFLLPVLPGYQGPLTFQLWSSGISLLKGKISVVDKQGNVLATAQSSSELGDVLTVSVASVATEKVYIRVEAAANDLFGAGGYGLVVKYDQLITTAPNAIQQAVLAGHQWAAGTDDSAAAVDTRLLLASGGQLDNDQHANDSLKNATTLNPVFDTAALRRFRFVGTISDATDADVYQLRSQPQASAIRGLTVAVETLPGTNLVPQIALFDKAGQSVPVKLIANGDGLVMAHADGIQANQDYLVKISGAGTGNYSLTANYDDVAITRTLLSSGTLSPQQPDQGANLYVAKPQLFSFALDSQATAGASAGQIIWATVYDDRRRTVAFLGGPVGQLRSGDSVFLEPGTYHIHFEGRDATGTGPISAAYQFFADAVSDSLGSVLIDAGNGLLFICVDDGSGGMFCYPDNPPTTDPFGTGPSGAPVFDPNNPVIPPDGGWFSPPPFTPTNPVNPLDVNNDGQLAPSDALMVINFLNDTGAGAAPIAPVFDGFLDTNADGFIAPIDALVVINEINATSFPSGEGEAGGPVSAVQLSTMQLSTEQLSTVQSSTVQSSAVQSNSAPSLAVLPTMLPDATSNLPLIDVINLLALDTAVAGSPLSGTTIKKAASGGQVKTTI